MKKLLLSFALMAAATLPVAAQDYVLYVGTKAENGSVTNYLPVTDGATFTATPQFHDGDLECAAFVKLANNTSANATATLNVTKVMDNNEFNGAFVLFQTCMGGLCQEPPLTLEVEANSETEGGTAEHIGYTALSITQEEADAIKFDAKYDVTLQVGNFTQNFTINFLNEDASVGTLAAGNAVPEYFNLQGMRVTNPAKGEVYIVRRGATVTKTLMH